MPNVIMAQLTVEADFVVVAEAVRVQASWNDKKVNVNLVHVITHYI